MSFDRHMFDDFRPYIFKTTDGGRIGPTSRATCRRKRTCSRSRGSEEHEPALRRHHELGLFASYNGGKDWFALNLKNLPNVAVHDILVHPRENDLILATHGRSIWIFDDATAIQQMTPQILSSNAHLFPVRRRCDTRVALRVTALATKCSPVQIRRQVR